MVDNRIDVFDAFGNRSNVFNSAGNRNDVSNVGGYRFDVGDIWENYFDCGSTLRCTGSACCRCFSCGQGLVSIGASVGRDFQNLGHRLLWRLV